MMLSMMLMLAACGSAEPELSTEAKAAQVAAAIEADPSQADAALKAAGMTEAEYEAALFDIAADAEKTEAFLNAH